MASVFGEQAVLQVVALAAVEMSFGIDLREPFVAQQAETSVVSFVLLEASGVDHLLAWLAFDAL